MLPGHEHEPDVRDRKVCQNCARRPRRENAALLEAQYMLQIERLTRLSPVCHECSTLLPGTGVRWWINTAAAPRRECTWHGHPGWVHDS